MIIKVKQGDSAEGLLEYQRRLKGTPEEQAGVRVFAKQGIYNVENAAAALDRLATTSGRKNAIVHLIIRAERGLSDPEWNTAMTAVLKEAGLSTHRWIAFLHDHDDDDPGDHMHIAAVAVDREGNPPPRFLRSKSLDRRVTRKEADALPHGDVNSRAWDSQLRRRLMSTARRLEDELGLRPLARDRAAQAEPVRDKAKSSQGGRDRQRRTGIPPLADLLDMVATQEALDEADYDARAVALARLDLALRPFIRKNGDMAGLRLHRISDLRLHCPVSALGARYSLKALDQRSPVAFANWYGNETATSPDVPDRAATKAEPLQTRYEDYTRNVAVQQRKIREARVALTTWHKSERAKALARRKAAVPAASIRSARLLRAAATASYHQQRAQIDAEAARQREALDAAWVGRKDFIGWLAIEGQTDPAAARNYAALRTRGAAMLPSPAAAVPTVSTAPISTEPAPPGRLSTADYAAIVAEQEHLMRQSDALLAAAAILQQARTMDALTARLDAIGVKLILDADRQDRRVHVTPDAVRIDDKTMMTVRANTLLHHVLDQAQATHTAQIEEERRLAFAIHCAQGLPQRIGETPASWLHRIFKGSLPTRWLTPAQDAAVRRGWEAQDDDTPQRPAPVVTTALTHLAAGRPAPPLSPPTKAVGRPALHTASPEPQPAVHAHKPALPSPPSVARPHSHVYEAMAMMRTQRPMTTPPRPNGEDVGKPEKGASAPVAIGTAFNGDQPPTEARLAPPLHAAPVVTPQPNTKPSARIPATAEAPISTPASSASEARAMVSQEAMLIAQWLRASEAAKTDPTRQRHSETLAAQLIAHDDLAILAPEMQAQANREADAHQRRKAQETREAVKGQASQPAPAALLPVPVQVPVPPHSPAEAPPSPRPPDRDKPLDPAGESNRAAKLRHFGNNADPWQRS